MVCKQSGFLSNRFNLASPFKCLFVMRPYLELLYKKNTALGILTDEKHPMHKILTTSQTMVFYNTTEQTIVLQIFSYHSHPVSRSFLISTKCHLREFNASPYVTTHHQPAASSQQYTHFESKEEPFFLHALPKKGVLHFAFSHFK